MFKKFRNKIKNKVELLTLTADKVHAKIDAEINSETNGMKETCEESIDAFANNLPYEFGEDAFVVKNIISENGIRLFAAIVICKAGVYCIDYAPYLGSIQCRTANKYWNYSHGIMQEFAFLSPIWSGKDKIANIRDVLNGIIESWHIRQVIVFHDTCSLTFPNESDHGYMITNYSNTTSCIESDNNARRPAYSIEDMQKAYDVLCDWQNYNYENAPIMVEEIQENMPAAGPYSSEEADSDFYEDDYEYSYDGDQKETADEDEYINEDGLYGAKEIKRAEIRKNNARTFKPVYKRQ